MYSWMIAYNVHIRVELGLSNIRVIKITSMGYYIISQKWFSGSKSVCRESKLLRAYSTESIRDQTILTINCSGRKDLT